MKLQDQYILVSFDVVCLFTNVLVEETLQIIGTKMETEQESIHQFNLKAGFIMKLLELCMQITYFEVGGHVL
jgi:hypothetical protein